MKHDAISLSSFKSRLELVYREHRGCCALIDTSITHVAVDLLLDNEQAQREMRVAGGIGVGCSFEPIFSVETRFGGVEALFCKCSKCDFLQVVI